MPSVLEVADYHGPYPGNFIPSLIAVGDAVRERLGFAYHCAFPREMEDRPWVRMLTDAGVGVSFLESGAGLRDRVAAMEELMRRTDARVVRTHFTRWDVEAGIAGRRRRVPVLWNIHTGNLEYGWRGHLRDLVKARTLGRLLCRTVICISDEIAADARRRGFPAGRIALVRNGIDVSRFDALPEPGAAKAALGVGADRDVVLLLGWTPQRKGVDVLVRAVAEPEPLAGVALVVVGGAETRAALPTELPGWLHLVAPVEDAAQLYAAADLFVSASREEAFSYAIGEAMAACLPVVSSDIPGPAAYFEAPGLRRYPVEDAAALRAAVAAVLADPDRAALGERNRAFVSERLGLDRHVDATLAAFSAVV
jgi:glycosyltransferase involved in cell wall biosynthesis